MSDLSINCILTQQGVEMGDHAQDITEAVRVKPGDTIESLVERTLMKEPPYWEDDPVPVPNPRNYLTIRLAE